MLISEQQKSDMWPWGPAETWWWCFSQVDVQPAQDTHCTLWFLWRWLHCYMSSWTTFLYSHRQNWKWGLGPKNQMSCRKTKCNADAGETGRWQSDIKTLNIVVHSGNTLSYASSCYSGVVFMNTFCLYLCCFPVMKLFHAVVSADYGEMKPIASTSLFYCVLQLLYDAAHCCRDYKFANKPPAAP